MRLSPLSRLTLCPIIFGWSASLAMSTESLICERDRPTFNQQTRDPRPDILPYWISNFHLDYRRLYNRPTYVGGKIAHLIEPSSQEAMVWAEAKQLGLYQPHHQPPLCRKYYAPKPWQRLAIGARPDSKASADRGISVQSNRENFLQGDMNSSIDNGIYYTEELLLDDE
jgi:hypothetical protein